MARLKHKEKAPAWGRTDMEIRLLDCIALLSIYHLITDAEKHAVLQRLDEQRDAPRP